MYRIVNTRLVIEKPTTHEKYYPPVIRASTQQTYPFSISYADIEIVSNTQAGTSGYIGQVRFDDIVRLQVSIKYNPYQKTVWQDIFEGRIMDMSSMFGNSNNVTLFCQGHEVEAETAIIEEDYSFATATDARSVLSYFSKYLSRLSYSASYADTGTSFPTYDSTANQTYMRDLFSDMEAVSGYNWAVKVVPMYAGGNLSTRYIQWREMSQTASEQYKIIEGTSRMLNADFEVAGKGVRTAYRIYGDTPEGGSQYTGYASDASLISLYGKRTEVDTQTWVHSNSLAAAIAAGQLSEWKTPEVSGQVELIGTPEAEIGDLVYCKIPSEELNGESVNGNFTVYRVNHEIDRNSFKTNLDLGKVKKSIYDYIGQVSTVAKTCKKNQVK